MKLRLVIIGYGAIAIDLIERLRNKYNTDLNLAVLLRVNSSARSRVPKGIDCLSNMQEILEFKPDLVVEAAGHQAVHEYAQDCLLSGLSFVAASVGAMSDESFYQQLCQSAIKGRSKLVFPSGAIGALDYLHAIQGLPDSEVVYESRKPPSAWTKELEQMGKSPPIEKEVVLFDGHARDAARRYPQNLNVAASLALAGVGFEATKVRIVVDPKALGNTHGINASGSFGSLELKIMNKPSPTNPKTSWVVGLSVMAAIERFFSPVVFG